MTKLTAKRRENFLLKGENDAPEKLYEPLIIHLIDVREKINARQRTEIGRAMLYKTIQELKEMDLVDTEKGIILTDAGRKKRRLKK